MERTLAAIALVLGGLAAISGAPQPSGRPPGISALDLAAAIRDGHGGPDSPWVMDLRSKNEWGERRVPSAQHAEGPIEGPTDHDRTLVLYANASTPIEATAASLRAAGYRRVYVLEGGMDAWLDQVMHPQVSAGDDRVIELSRYFGGLPRARGGSPTAVATSAVAPARPRGGC
ncbi:MAG: rhodanese-like domain-containing protein [Acidobacteriota bacterium]